MVTDEQVRLGCFNTIFQHYANLLHKMHLLANTTEEGIKRQAEK